ncbi:HAD family hydrolase [Nocardia brasiliensis]|uniref:HAD family hydrolase n=1 Tax=Nocardia brasiliensis TaxID=37326 RepID=UPI003D77A3E8
MARPTESTPELIQALVGANRTVGIVSNNSTVAADASLKGQGVCNLISSIYARTPSNFTQLKPDPHLIFDAMNDLSRLPNECVFVGDSVSDIQAGRTANVPTIALANRSEKISRFRIQDPDAIVTRVSEILAALELSLRLQLDPLQSAH